jgi:D-psicose/D-tagatose/L-ribulose 3-epimerase
VFAAQALLFGRRDLTLFDDADTRQRTLDYLCIMVRVCARLGARALVFGSPKNAIERTALWNTSVAWTS